jgi:predicted TIM-barrel fold metal-dependent hydrolase
MNTYAIMDADAHMCEPPNLWVERIDRRFRERAPRIVKDPDGKKGAFFICEDLPPFRVSGAFAAGQTFDQKFLEAGLDSAPAGGWDPAARLKDMDLDGVAAQMLYTTVGFTLFGMRDAEFQEACFSVYNDWLAEFCSYAPKRLGGLGLISLFDVERGTRELERCKKLGLKGAMIWATPPEGDSYGSPAYHRFWTAAQELQMPLSLHILTGARRSGRFGGEMDPAHIYVMVVTRPQEVQTSLMNFIFYGVLERFPRLKLVSAENDISWVPQILERADRYYYGYQKAYDISLPLKPSDYFRRQVYATFIEDSLGLKTYRHVGADNFMWSTDYPHRAATWPHSQEVLAREFADLPENDRSKLVRENMAKLYGFDLAARGIRAS